MSSLNKKKYVQFVELFKKANSTLQKQKQYKQAKDLWKIATNDQTLYEKNVNELMLKAAKSKTSILPFWITPLSPTAKKKKDNTSPCSSMQTQSDSSETETRKKMKLLK